MSVYSAYGQSSAGIDSSSAGFDSSSAGLLDDGIWLQPRLLYCLSLVSSLVVYQINVTLLRGPLSIMAVISGLDRITNYQEA